MSNELKDLSKWIYYTGLFLSDFDKHIESDQNYKLVFNEFITERGFHKDTNFKLWNQGTMIMLLYGLLVLPKEFWTRFLSDDSDLQHEKDEADRIIFESFEFNTRKHFEDCENNISSRGLANEIFLRRLRNAIAHNRIELIKGDDGEIKFTNRPPNNEINFAVKITPKNLTEFLNELSIFFINNLN